MAENGSGTVENSVVIVGGYGVVGRQLAQGIRRRHPDIPLIIAGRNRERADEFARTMAKSSGMALDVAEVDPLHGLKPRAVIAAVNDPRDNLLLEAARNGIPYLDITRWTDRVRSAISSLSLIPLRAPVMLASGWMAGVASLVAVAAARKLQSTDTIDVSVLYSVRDMAGPDSVGYLDRLSAPFEVLREGTRAQVWPCTDPKRIAFPGGYEAKAYRFDVPDQFTLPIASGAGTVSSRIAFDDAMSAFLLVAFARTGVWKLIGGEKFASLRRSLLYNPGPGASHEIVIEATGLDASGMRATVRADVVDPEGQTRLAAVGALIQLERLLGLDFAPPPKNEIVYPDTAPQIEAALQVLRQFGASVKFSVV